MNGVAHEWDELMGLLRTAVVTCGQLQSPKAREYLALEGLNALRSIADDAETLLAKLEELQEQAN